MHRRAFVASLAAVVVASRAPAPTAAPALHATWMRAFTEWEEAVLVRRLAQLRAQCISTRALAAALRRARWGNPEAESAEIRSVEKG
jgi:hypothetical protein